MLLSCLWTPGNLSSDLGLGSTLFGSFETFLVCVEGAKHGQKTGSDNRYLTLQLAASPRSCEA